MKHLIISFIIILLLSGCEKPHRSISENDATRGKTTIVGLWICDKTPTKNHYPKILITDRAPDLLIPVYNRYEVRFDVDESLSTTHYAEYRKNDIEGKVCYIMNKNKTGTGRVKDIIVLQLFRVSADTLELRHSGKSYYWIRY